MKILLTCLIATIAMATSAQTNIAQWRLAAVDTNYLIGQRLICVKSIADSSERNNSDIGIILSVIQDASMANKEVFKIQTLIPTMELLKTNRPNAYYRLALDAVKNDLNQRNYLGLTARIVLSNPALDTNGVNAVAKLVEKRIISEKNFADVIGYIATNRVDSYNKMQLELIKNENIPLHKRKNAANVLATSKEYATNGLVTGVSEEYSDSMAKIKSAKLDQNNESSHKDKFRIVIQSEAFLTFFITSPLIAKTSLASVQEACRTNIDAGNKSLARQAIRKARDIDPIAMDKVVLQFLEVRRVRLKRIP